MDTRPTSRGLSPKPCRRLSLLVAASWALALLAGVPQPVATTAERPPGKVKHDEFFGDMQTYRGQVDIRIPMAAPEGGRQLMLVTESQGCADAGICYPPQRQILSLAVPVAGEAPSSWVVAPVGRPAWLK